MEEKRGLLIILPVLLLLVIPSIFGVEPTSNGDEDPLAAGEAPSSPEIYASTDDAAGCDPGDISITIQTTPKCGLPPNSGCNVYSIQSCDLCWDGDGCGEILIGTIITQKGYYTFGSHVVSGGLAENIGCKHPKTSDSNQYLCDNDKYWKQCSLSDEGKVSWVNNQLYKCTKENELAIWKQQEGTDLDHDGHTTAAGDCDDNPEDDPNAENCPELEEGSIDCQYPQHSSCAICINPGRPEVCGDKINNDCGGSNEPISQLEGKTSDNCNKFAAGCEQKSLNDLNLGQEGDESGTPDADSEDEININSHTNIYDESFSWIATDDGGRCCGFNGIDDLGDVETAPDGKRLCLSSDSNLVGVAGGNVKALAGWDDLCQGDWCWVPASNQANAFKVVTIKNSAVQPDGTLAQPYDIVSDSVNWQKCTADYDEGPIKDITGNPFIVDPESANHFYCYQEGRHWSWAECFGLKKNNENVKGRAAGQAPYSLFLDGATELEGERILINPSSILPSQGAYAEIYRQADNQKVFFDFSGYNQLEFFFRITDESGVGVTPSELKPPLAPRLRIYGPPPAEGLPPVYVDRSIMGDVRNGPFFSPDYWMHAVVPIPDNLLGVSAVEFSLPESIHSLTIKNAYLSKKGQETPICSGKDDDERSSWLTSFDDGNTNSRINAREMCEKHFGLNAWLGDDGQVDTASANCCGNNEEPEYYAGPSANNQGCWNSQPLADKETVMNVEVGAITGSLQLKSQETFKYISNFSAVKDG